LERTLPDGKRVPGSGALGAPGDVRVGENYLLSAKWTEAREFALRLHDLEIICEEAGDEGVSPMMAFRFDAIHEDAERDWVLLPVRVLVGLLNRRGSP
jgi:hypothetical protein